MITTTMERDIIFISHSSSDTEFATRLAKDLINRGLHVWLDVFDIAPGSDWNLSIQEALTHSKYVLIVWSKASVISSEVLAEVFQAKAAGKLIIQVFIDDCKRPAQFDRLQNIDFRLDYDEAFSKLFDFFPIARRKQRLKELESVLPANTYPTIPRLRLR